MQSEFPGVSDGPPKNQDWDKRHISDLAELTACKAWRKVNDPSPVTAEAVLQTVSFDYHPYENEYKFVQVSY